MNENGVRHGVVLSGGGADGAYEVGVLKSLLTGHSPLTPNNVPLAIDALSGTSAGAVNAAFLASHFSESSSAAVQALEGLWIEDIAGPTSGPTGNGVFRLRFDPAELLNWRSVSAFEPLRHLSDDTVHCLHSWLTRARSFLGSDESTLRSILDLVDISSLICIDPLRELVESKIDLAKLIANRDQVLRIAATDWDKGKITLFENQRGQAEFNDRRITRQIIDETTGHQAILASAAIPGVFPPVELGGSCYVDGGLLLNTPLSPVIREGVDVVHVVYFDPLESLGAKGPRQSTFATMDRVFAMALSNRVNQQITDSFHINRGLSEMEHCEGESDQASLSKTGGIPDERLPWLVGRMAARRKASNPRAHKPLTIHRYRPKINLGGILGLLEFGVDRVAKLIAQGYEDAKHHSCEENSCIIPDR